MVNAFASGLTQAVGSPLQQVRDRSCDDCGDYHYAANIDTSVVVANYASDHSRYWSVVR